jgi:hypothetical protein
MGPILMGSVSARIRPQDELSVQVRRASSSAPFAANARFKALVISST